MVGKVHYYFCVPCISKSLTCQHWRIQQASKVLTCGCTSGPVCLGTTYSICFTLTCKWIFENSSPSLRTMPKKVLRNPSCRPARDSTWMRDFTQSMGYTINQRHAPPKPPLNMRGITPARHKHYRRQAPDGPHSGYRVYICDKHWLKISKGLSLKACSDELTSAKAKPLQLCPISDSI